MARLVSAAHVASRSVLARIIDYAALKPTVTPAEIKRLCIESREYNFWSLCVTPVHVRQAVRMLGGSSTKVCAVVSFPFGSSTTKVKLMEAQGAIVDGASELDMVSNIGALKSGDSQSYFDDINELASLCRNSNIVLKVILECCYLTLDEKVRGTRLAERAGADFVKTSTGFGPGGATAADVLLLRKLLPSRMGVKAAGGIGTLGRALEMIEAGANRLGTSSAVSIIEELPP